MAVNHNKKKQIQNKIIQRDSFNRPKKVEIVIFREILFSNKTSVSQGSITSKQTKKKEEESARSLSIFIFNPPEHNIVTFKYVVNDFTYLIKTYKRLHILLNRGE